MAYLICYDIEHNYLRKKMGDMILDHGFERINLSVYLGNIEQRSLTYLEDKLTAMLKDKGKETDSLIFLPVTASQIDEMRIYGKNDLDPGEISGSKSSLIL
ncbi:MAG: CRISPR-associated endonuclease Cas2 [Bacteroidia bacterium]|nr:CRISPR-associated endonuclease Cas2 [Bacteroidia bacterium]